MLKHVQRLKVKFSIIFLTALTLSFFGSSAVAQADGSFHPTYAGNPNGQKVVFVFWNPSYEKAKELWPTIKKIGEAVDQTTDTRLIIQGDANNLKQRFLMEALLYFYENSEVGKDKAWKYLNDMTAAGNEALDNSEKWVEAWAEKNDLLQYQLISSISKWYIGRSAQVSFIKTVYNVKTMAEDTPIVVINNTKKLTRDEITLEAVLKALEETEPDSHLP